MVMYVCMYETSYAYIYHACPITMSHISYHMFTYVVTYVTLDKLM